MKQSALLTRGVSEIIVLTDAEHALASGKKLRVKLGIDPTTPDVHLGHTVVLRKLREFQDAGHEAVLIIGDFTAMIGDPTGKSETRKPLTEDEIKNNMKHYLDHAQKVIDINKAEIHYNSEWFKNMSALEGILGLSRAATLQQVLHRADFKKRLEAGEDITILEVEYPLFQGYDSVKIKADIEIGGTDQKFNLLMGRQIQRFYKMPEQNIIMMPLLIGTDGERKMSKSLGNYISLTDAPNDMFGKLMAIPDSLMPSYFELLTDVAMPVDLPAREAKLLLAKTIVTMYHGVEAGESAKQYFIAVFSDKKKPADIPTLHIAQRKAPVVDILLAAGVTSKSEARRLITQGGVKLDEAPITDPDAVLTLKDGAVLHIGKRKFFRITL